VKELVYGGFGRITKEVWAKAEFRRTFTVYNSIHRTVRYASSLACSFNQIIWGIKWFSPGLLKLKKLE
jgi:hypothetical protein